MITMVGKVPVVTGSAYHGSQLSGHMPQGLSIFVGLISTALVTALFLFVLGVFQDCLKDKKERSYLDIGYPFIVSIGILLAVIGAVDAVLIIGTLSAIFQ